MNMLTRTVAIMTLVAAGACTAQDDTSGASDENVNSTTEALKRTFKVHADMSDEGGFTPVNQVGSVIYMVPGPAHVDTIHADFEGHYDETNMGVAAIDTATCKAVFNGSAIFDGTLLGHPGGGVFTIYGSSTDCLTTGGGNWEFIGLSGDLAGVTAGGKWATTGTASPFATMNGEATFPKPPKH